MQRKGAWSRRGVAAALSAAASAAMCLAAPRETAAQYAPPNPQYICQLAVQSVQPGGPSVYSVYGQQLLQVIYQQTGGSGVYVTLMQLGQITNIIVGGVSQLPNGTFIACRVMHVNGYSDWQIGFSPYTQRIENSTFVPHWTAAQVMPSQPVPQYTPASPAPTQAPPAIQQQPSQPTQPPTAPSQSEACKKFPNLC